MRAPLLAILLSPLPALAEQPAAEPPPWSVQHRQAIERLRRHERHAEQPLTALLQGLDGLPRGSVSAPRVEEYSRQPVLFFSIWTKAEDGAPTARHFAAYPNGSLFLLPELSEIPATGSMPPTSHVPASLGARGEEGGTWVVSTDPPSYFADELKPETFVVQSPPQPTQPAPVIAASAPVDPFAPRREPADPFAQPRYEVREGFFYVDGRESGWTFQPYADGPTLVFDHGGALDRQRRRVPGAPRRPHQVRTLDGEVLGNYSGSGQRAVLSGGRYVQRHLFPRGDGTYSDDQGRTYRAERRRVGVQGCGYGSCQPVYAEVIVQDPPAEETPAARRRETSPAVREVPSPVARRERTGPQEPSGDPAGSLEAGKPPQTLRFVSAGGTGGFRLEDNYLYYVDQAGRRSPGPVGYVAKLPIQGMTRNGRPLTENAIFFYGPDRADKSRWTYYAMPGEESESLMLGSPSSLDTSRVFSRPINHERYGERVRESLPLVPIRGTNGNFSIEKRYVDLRTGRHYILDTSKSLAVFRPDPAWRPPSPSPPPSPYDGEPVESPSDMPSPVLVQGAPRRGGRTVAVVAGNDVLLGWDGGETPWMSHASGALLQTDGPGLAIHAGLKPPRDQAQALFGLMAQSDQEGARLLYASFMGMSRRWHGYEGASGRGSQEEFQRRVDAELAAAIRRRHAGADYAGLAGMDDAAVVGWYLGGAPVEPPRDGIYLSPGALAQAPEYGALVGIHRAHAGSQPVLRTARLGLDSGIWSLRLDPLYPETRGLRLGQFERWLDDDDRGTDSWTFVERHAARFEELARAVPQERRARVLPGLLREYVAGVPNPYDMVQRSGEQWPEYADQEAAGRFHDVLAARVLDELPPELRSLAAAARS